MKYDYFEINNFKGIEKVKIDLSFTPKNKIFTLVGLNESGKTTILEGMNFLTYREDLDPLNLLGQTKLDIHDLIPISKRSNFNEKIVIKAGYVLNEKDEDNIKYIAKKYGYKLTQPINKFEITQSYNFTNSKVENRSPKIIWTINLFGKKNKNRIDRKISGDDWQKIVNEVKGLLPRVLYFPNFLFEFPDKIYLENPPSDTEKHEFYKIILQDVLDAIGDGINLEDHIIKRANSIEKSDKQSLESVLLKMGAHITDTVFKNWNKIFKKSISDKEIVVNLDTEGSSTFLQLRLKEGPNIFTISERSLGFRWFFAFLLFTQYRGFRSNQQNNVLFLLDEPASNLHPSAQSQLLESFNNLPKECYIVYTTHSHHMINPDWLEGAYVVKNEGLNYSGQETEYNSKKTQITLYKYREFVANYPNQTTYYQPVLDVLDYYPSKLENIPNVLMLEGKNDYYTLNYILKILRMSVNFNLLPGSGAGSLKEVLRLYIAWGRDFIAILDSDKGGKKEQDKYFRLYDTLVKDKIFNLNEINRKWKNLGMEYLFETQERLDIQKLIFKDDKKFNKIHFNRAIQELYLKNYNLKLHNDTEANFKYLITFINDKLK